MPLDPALELFAGRLNSTQDPAEDLPQYQVPFWNALSKVVAEFNRACPLPFEDVYWKHGAEFVQLHVPAISSEAHSGYMWPDCFDFVMRCAEEWRGPDSEAKLGAWLVERATEFVNQFTAAVKSHNLTRLGRMELPEGTRGSLWCQPIRLVWDYYINVDAYVARLDMIGRKGA